MNIWIMIIWLITADHQLVEFGRAEFIGQEACEAALFTVSVPDDQDFIAICESIE